MMMLGQLQLNPKTRIVTHFGVVKRDIRFVVALIWLAKLDLEEKFFGFGKSFGG